ncbi:MAG: glycosyltransferase family 2 protein [Pseudomonadota bacterium]
MQTTTPKISIIIPAYNEEGFIADCISSLLNNGYPQHCIEIIIVDGSSTDRTRQIVENIDAGSGKIVLVHNEKKIVPVAMNLGIAAASHDIIIWVGAHATYEPDYLGNSVRILLEGNCASVGGVIKPVGNTLVGQAIAVATSSKFGIGNAKYRYANRRQTVDTVFGGCFLKQSVEQIGGFDESWIRNQDYEFNWRLRHQVGDIVLDPSIQCRYFCRESISGLARQYYQYGYWRFRTLRKHPSSFTFRQAAPVMLLAGLVSSAIMFAIHPVFAIVIPASYLALSLLVSLVLSYSSRRPSFLILLPIIFATLHLSWALGFCGHFFKRLLSISAFRQNGSS